MLIMRSCREMYPLVASSSFSIHLLVIKCRYRSQVSISQSGLTCKNVIGSGFMTREMSSKRSKTLLKKAAELKYFRKGDPRAKEIRPRIDLIFY